MRGKHVLVTGAGGSIGSVLCERLVHEGADTLTLLSLTESGLYRVERRLRALKSTTVIVPVLGSVLDRRLLEEICRGVDLIVHAAAHKHVPICEANPLAAIENNVRGTLELAQSAIEADVSQFVLISTDKAVNPLSVMGMTKRVAEMIVKSCAKKANTVFSTARFGNVLDSDGSVIPLWREQIARGGPITLTDPRCERYFMSIPEAVELICSVVGMGNGTFVFDMGKPRKLVDIAAEMTLRTDCKIEYIGLRPGEKLTEELYLGASVEPTEKAKILRVTDDDNDWRFTLLNDLLSASGCRNRRAVDILRAMCSIVPEAQIA